MTQSQGILQQSFEAIDNASGGVASQVVDTVKTSAQETAQQVAQTPLMILKSLIGMGDSPSAQESSTSGADPFAQMQMADGSSGQPLGQPTEFQKKMFEDRQKREQLIRQHREMLAQYQQQHQKTKSQEAQLKQQEEVQEEQIKEQKKIEKKQKQTPMWKQILGNINGTGEGAKKPS